MVTPMEILGATKVQAVPMVSNPEQVLDGR
jgi:hypothetical protein